MHLTSPQSLGEVAWVRKWPRGAGANTRLCDIFLLVDLSSACYNKLLSRVLNPVTGQLVLGYS